jgi:hypothetical protein
MLIYPLSDLLDRLSIVKLKVERIGEDSCKKEYEALTNELKEYNFNESEDFINRLYEINGKIWDLESDIRKGKENELGLEEVGRRAIAIRGLNKIRVGIKNEVVIKSNSGFVDVKMNHASE